MAIIIPSAKTYDRQNPKVRDNVIERIEVSAKKIVPNNEYETPVYNNSFYNFKDGKKSMEINDVLSTPSNGKYTIYSVVSYILPTYCNLSILIEKLQKNKYISDLILGSKINEETNEETNNIYYTIQGKKQNGTIKADYYFNLADFPEINDKEIQILDPTITKEENVNISSNYLSNEDKELLSTELKTTHPDVSIDITAKIEEKTNLKNLTAVDEILNDIDYYRIVDENGSNVIKILAGIEKISLWGEAKVNRDNPIETDYMELNGTYESLLPQELTLTINGNTIGIDLTDETLYIKGETQKKVQSFDGNELMQTSNYLLDNGEKAIETMYEKTCDEYSFGKETATIRCSISDYYNEENEKVISIKKYDELPSSIVSTSVSSISSIGLTMHLIVVNIDKPYDYDVIVELEYYLNNKQTKKISIKKGEQYTTYSTGVFFPTDIKVLSVKSEHNMAFKEYDEVIPMVYGVDGKDKPMSIYQDGTPKVFKVLGTNMYYDGAVWQELSLQEIIIKNEVDNG